MIGRFIGVGALRRIPTGRAVGICAHRCLLVGGHFHADIGPSRHVDAAAGGVCLTRSCSRVSSRWLSRTWGRLPARPLACWSRRSVGGAVIPVIQGVIADKIGHPPLFSSCRCSATSSSSTTASWAHAPPAPARTWLPPHRAFVLKVIDRPTEVQVAFHEGHAEIPLSLVHSGRKNALAGSSQLDRPANATRAASLRRPLHSLSINAVTPRSAHSGPKPRSPLRRRAALRHSYDPARAWARRRSASGASPTWKRRTAQQRADPLKNRQPLA